MRIRTCYELHTGKLTKPVSFGVVSDLHDEPYEDLWPLLEDCDALLAPGDVVNRYTQTFDRGVGFLRDAARRMPTFFSLGNHETKMQSFRTLMQALESTGAEILVNRYVPFGECWIGGWYDPEIVQKPDCMDEFEKLPGCRVLLCHKPEHYLKFLRSRDVDLVGNRTAGQMARRACMRPGSISSPNIRRAS